MKFSEAKARLKELAKGKYHSIMLNLIEYSDGYVETKCILYIDGHSHVSGSTWERAFIKLDDMLNPQNHIEEFHDIEPKQAVGR